MTSTGFPAYTRADDTLHFNTGDIHIREIVKYEDYKRFGSNVKILYKARKFRRRIRKIRTRPRRIRIRTKIRKSRTQRRTRNRRRSERTRFQSFKVSRFQPCFDLCAGTQLGG